tara:strand:+ start:682 stop:891 length:210 start_codon:yes stop_codon:yes gene_type:complete
MFRLGNIRLQQIYIRCIADAHEHQLVGKYKGIEGIGYYPMPFLLARLLVYSFSDKALIRATKRLARLGT